jgi:hypothetical protein
MQKKPGRGNKPRPGFFARDSATWKTRLVKSDI